MLRIGLLGGSFNPPHAGHLHLAQFAQEKLKLNQVWLLPVPQNTLKSEDDMASFEARFQMCQGLAKEHDWLHVKEDEQQIGTNETIDTVRYMQKTYPHQFIWLMGADSFASVHNWGMSHQFYGEIPTAVFSRTKEENQAALNSLTALKQSPQKVDLFINSPQNGWAFFEMPLHTARATDIRDKLKNMKKNQEITGLSPAVQETIVGENLYKNP